MCMVGFSLKSAAVHNLFINCIPCKCTYPSRVQWIRPKIPLCSSMESAQWSLNFHQVKLPMLAAMLLFPRCNTGRLYNTRPHLVGLYVLRNTQIRWHKTLARADMHQQGHANWSFLDTAGLPRQLSSDYDAWQCVGRETWEDDGLMNSPYGKVHIWHACPGALFRIFQFMQFR